jgi:hypothetical protein
VRRSLAEAAMIARNIPAAILTVKKSVRKME